MSAGLLERLRTRTRTLGQLIWREHRSPGRVALALFLGFIVGCTPIFGAQLFICMALAWALRLNLPIMYAAANISIPPMIPLIGGASIELGTYLFTGHHVQVSRADFDRATMHHTAEVFFWAWLRGGVILGAAIGLVVGGVVYVLLCRRRVSQPAEEQLNEAVVDSPLPPEHAPAITAALTRAAQRYAQTPRRFRYYARAKYRLDPCYRALCARIPAGTTVVDLGCGLGMLAVALAELGGDRQCFGIDWDSEKIAAGQTAAADLPTVTLQRGDLRETSLPACDVITLIDVLHYYEPAIQTQVLIRAAAALRPHGMLLIRETDPARRGGARLTRVIERLMVRLGWNRGPDVHYRPLPELHAQLHTLGFTTEQLELAGATHPGNVLLVARKPTAQESPAES